MPDLSRHRKTLSNSLPHLLLIGALAMSWVGLKAVTNTSCSILVVTSQSMEPTFSRGDLILISNWKDYVVAGDIPVVWFPGEDLPFVHRAVEVRWKLANSSEHSLE